ncbi:MAG: AAA family ATPase [Clostridium sp.]|nr:AAA family ATPase [Clostridium sp.]
MGKLNVVVADTDEAYVESIVNYFMTNHSQRVQISSFTKHEFLYDFLSELRKIDILLVSPEMYTELLPKDGIAEIFILTSGELPEKCKGLNYIDKNQIGDEFVKEIADRHLKDEDNAADESIIGEPILDEETIEETIKDRKTKVVAIYSPLGGVGKTTIAVSSSIYCGKRGLEVFYLNFEPFQSTPLFFNCKNEKSYSKLLQYVKERRDDLHQMIEASKQLDTAHNVYYLSPPESIFDILEAEPRDFRRLINEFKSMGMYDIVIVDMSSELSDRNIALLEACDEVVLVLAQDAISNIKAECFSQQLDVLLKRKGLDFTGKLTLVLNKYNFHMALEVETADVNEEFISIYIPAVPGMTAIKGNAQLVDLQGEFGASIQELMDKFILQS